MKSAEELYQFFLRQKKDAVSNLERIEKELSEEGNVQKASVIKEIKGNLYYYTQWKENGKLCTQYLCPVEPGGAVEMELQIEKRQRLLDEKNQYQIMKKYAEQMLVKIDKDRKKQPIIDSYSFEVFWKDEITARVHVKGKNVRISRYTEHPLKQIFADKKMSRYQLNRILELRCWEKERPDMDEILKCLGLKEYNPYEIVRKTHGVSSNDYIWFRFPGEKITCKDVLVR